jgi:hypothetical protein
LLALLLKEKLPVADPLLCGRKVTVTCALFPEARVIGNAPALRTNSPLLVPAEEITTLDPDAVTLLVKLLVEPTETLPKFNAEGERASLPAAAPVPEREILALELDETTARFPLTLPACNGANFTVNVMLCPAERLAGTVSPLRLNPVPLIEALEILRVAVPVFLTVTFSDALFPA